MWRPVASFSAQTPSCPLRARKFWILALTVSFSLAMKTRMLILWPESSEKVWRRAANRAGWWGKLLA